MARIQVPRSADHVHDDGQRDEQDRDDGAEDEAGGVVGVRRDGLRPVCLGELVAHRVSPHLEPVEGPGLEGPVAVADLVVAVLRPDGEVFHVRICERIVRVGHLGRVVSTLLFNGYLI